MKLTDLYPSFLKRCGEHEFQDDVPFADADGIMFHCPRCSQEKGKPEGTHMIICWNLSIPQTVNPIPGRWNLVGTGFADLSLINGSSSVALEDGCKAHFWIKNGEIIFC